MGMLHRLRKKRLRRRRFVLPALAGALVLGVAVFWTAAGAEPAQAVTTSTTVAATTTTSEFALKGQAKTQVEELTAKAAAVQAEIDAFNEEFLMKTEEHNKCLEDLSAANARMAELRRTVADARAEQAKQQAQLAQRLKAIYMSGGRDQLLQMLLPADGLQDLYNRVRLVSTLADRDRVLVTNLKESGSRLGMLAEAAEHQKAEQLRLRDELQVRAKEIEAKIAQRERILAAVDQRVAAIVQQERQRQAAEQARLQAELQARLEAELQARLALLAAQQSVLNGGQLYQGKLPQIDNALTNQLVETAAYYMGVRYVWGGNRPSTGMDCSGFTRYVFRQHGVTLPHYSGYQARMGVPVPLEEIQPGDLVAFGSPVHHVGIYIGDGLYIHTPSEVKIAKLAKRKDLTAIRRFPIEPRTGDPLWN